MPNKQKTRGAESNDTTPPTTFTDGASLPKLLVFDLDYTLWPFWCDTHIDPPLRPLAANHSAFGRRVKDAHGGTWGFYSEVPAVLRACRERGVGVGVASRSHTPDIAEDLLRFLHVPAASSSSTTEPGPKTADASSATGGAASEEEKKSDAGTRALDFFGKAALQIYPGSKTTHLKRLSKGLGVPFEDMLFFDDEERNRNVERELGVCFWLVRDGVNKAEVDRGVEKWRKARGVVVAPGKKGDDRGVDVVLDLPADAEGRV